jgi:hypothetical protein
MGRVAGNAHVLGNAQGESYDLVYRSDRILSYDPVCKSDGILRSSNIGDATMISSLLVEWKTFLETTSATLGVVLVLGGCSLISSGWRFEQFSRVFTFMVAGTILGRIVGDGSGSELIDALMGACVFGAVGFVLGRAATPLAMGVGAAMAAWVVIGGPSLPAPTIYILMALSGAAAAMAAVTNARGAIIILTSCVGASLFVSGVINVIAESRSLSPHFRTMSAYAVFYPVLLIVPTVSGIFMQLGAARRDGCGDVGQ